MPLGSRDTYNSGDNGSTYTPVPNPGENPTTISDVYTKSESDTKYQAKADFDRWNRVHIIGTNPNFYQFVYPSNSPDAIGYSVKDLMHWALNVQQMDNRPLVFGWMGDNYVKQTMFWIRSTRDTPLPMVLERNDGNPASYSIAQRQSDGTVGWYHFDTPHRNVTGYKVLSNGQTSNTYWVPDGLGGRPLLRLQAYGTIQISVRGYRWIIEGDVEGVKQVNYLSSFSIVNAGDSTGQSMVDGTNGVYAMAVGGNLILEKNTNSKTVKISDSPLLNVGGDSGVSQVSGTRSVRKLLAGPGIDIQQQSTGENQISLTTAISSGNNYFSVNPSANNEFFINDFDKVGLYILNAGTASFYYLTYSFQQAVAMPGFGRFGRVGVLNSTGQPLICRAMITNADSSVRFFATNAQKPARYGMSEYWSNGTNNGEARVQKASLGLVSSVLGAVSWKDTQIPAAAFIEIVWRGRAVEVITDWT